MTTTTPADCKPNRFTCCVDLEALARAGRKRLVIHVPASMYARLCKGSLDEDEVHLYLGRKRGPPPAAADTAAAAGEEGPRAVPKEAFTIKYPSEPIIVDRTQAKP